ncbi:GUN4 domain-containing protein [Microcoleus sp. FACHB-672]|uniref:GUN4 domain-containing protein n=1 Tax=Microcoleus sp. FACHB-672 TaxID=2692825 RepID=UPI001683918A|nr:GUN4 domain-containing protein [Microcoleus sp. FACHB-672]MBD2042660.1 GUN4 domain-containing protein [Microcoleus sp. FACHB-672]
MVGTIGVTYFRVLLNKLIQNEVRKQSLLEEQIKAEKLKQLNVDSSELSSEVSAAIPATLPAQEGFSKNRTDAGFTGNYTELNSQSFEPAVPKQVKPSETFIQDKSNFYQPEFVANRATIKKSKLGNYKWKRLGLATILGCLIFTIILSPALKSLTEHPTRVIVAADSMSVNMPDAPKLKPIKPVLNLTNLKNSLRQKKWKAADRETYELVLKLGGGKSQSRGYLDYTEIESLPCAELRKIDKAWREASDKKLGFSAQQIIYKKQGQDWQRMYSNVGWGNLKGQKFKRLVDKELNRQSQKLEYKDGMQPNFKNPPIGHLPVTIGWVRGKEFPQFAELCKL